jgi:hypothetical protein
MPPKRKVVVTLVRNKSITNTCQPYEQTFCTYWNMILISTFEKWTRFDLLSNYEIES